MSSLPPEEQGDNGALKRCILSTMLDGAQRTAAEVFVVVRSIHSNVAEHRLRASLDELLAEGALRFNPDTQTFRKAYPRL